MPQITEPYKQLKSYLSNNVIIRLHGPDRKNIEKKSKKIWNKVIEFKDEDLIKVQRIFLFQFVFEVPFEPYE